jgi:hypothetical protein
MANQNIDIIRVNDTKANIPTTLINGQFGYVTDTDELAIKDSVGGMHYFGSTATSGTTDILINDNDATAYRVRENSNNYILIDTLDTGASMELGNTTTNPSFELLGTGDLTIGGSQIISAGEYIGLGAASARHYYAAGIIGIVGADFGVRTISPEGTLHVETSSSGAFTVNANADDGIFESGGNTGVTIVSPDANTSRLAFASPTNNLGATIEYTHDTALMELGTNIAGGQLRLNAGAGSTVMRLTSAGQVGIGVSPSYTLDVSGSLRTTDSVIFSSSGPHAIGTTLLDYWGLNYSGTFTSGGASTVVAGLAVTGNIVGANGDTTYHAGVNLTANMTTQDNSETIGHVVQLRVDDPTIVKGTDTVDYGVNIWVPEIATEGTKNYAIKLDQGTIYMAALSASQAVFTNADNELVSNTTTGSGDVVMSASPTLTGTINAANLTLSGDIVLAVEKALYVNSGGNKNLISVDTGDDVALGDTNLDDLYLTAGSGHTVYIREGSNPIITAAPAQISLWQPTLSNENLTIGNAKSLLFVGAGAITPATTLALNSTGAISIGSAGTTAINMQPSMTLTKDQDALTEIRIDNDNSGTSIDHMGYTMYDGAVQQFGITHNNNTDNTLIKNYVSGELQIESANDVNLVAGVDVYVEPGNIFYVNSTGNWDLTGAAGTCYLGSGGDLNLTTGNTDSYNFDNGFFKFTSGAGLQLGEIWYHDTGADVTLAAQDTWYQVAVFDTNGLSKGNVTPDHTNDHITVGDAGYYDIAYSVSSRSAASNKYEFAVFYNNGGTELTNSHTHRDTTVSGKVGSSATLFPASIPASATIELWVQRLDGGAVSKTLTIEQVNLNVRMQGAA